MGPQVILGAEEQHRELADVMFHFLDVDRNCPGMANLSWPPPKTEEKASKTSDLSTSHGLRSMSLHRDTGKKTGLPARLGGEEATRGRRHALQLLHACKKVRDCCTVPCRDKQLLPSVTMITA